MKVVNTPDLTAWTHEFTCHRCASKLKAEISDVYHEVERKYFSNSEPDSPGYNVVQYYVDCSMCQQYHQIADGQIPYLLREKIKGKSK